MRSRFVFRFEIPDAAAADRVLDAALPDGWREGRSELHAFRETCFDTPTRDLERKGASVLLTVHDDGGAWLRVERLERRAGDGGLRLRAEESRVGTVEPASLFRSDAEPARALRALTDPDRLAAALELETMRRVRRARTPEGTPVRVVVDRVTARVDDTAGELFILELAGPRDAAEHLAVLGSALREVHGLVPLLGTTAAHARRLLDGGLIDALTLRLRAAREVAVIAHDRGEILLLDDGENLCVPHAPGSGGRACRQALRRAFGHGQARIRRLGTRPGGPGRPALEVWLAEEISPDETIPGAVRVPLREALRKAGAPRMRDARTLAALHVVAASDFERWAAPPLRNIGPTIAAAPPEPLLRTFQRLESDGGALDAPAHSPPPTLLLNVELARLAFDERVLVCAEDPSVPLLERVRFLAIFGERLDDFFASRVARFKRLLARGEDSPTIDGLSPAEQLDLIAIRARWLNRRAYLLLEARLLPELAANGIRIERWAALGAKDRAYVRETYAPRILALATPLIADLAHPFPHVRNLRPALASIVRAPGSRTEHVVAIELPGELPRFLPLPGTHRFIPLEDATAALLPELYPRVDGVRAFPFRVTRSGVTELDSVAPDVLHAVEEEIGRRPFREVVRLEVDRTMPQRLRHLLLRAFQYEREEQTAPPDAHDVYPVGTLVDLAALHEIAGLELPELRYPPVPHRVPLDPERPALEQVRERDRLLHFPYDAFDASIERFLLEAARDPDVLSIKLALYRTGGESAIIAALHEARERGKEVVALVELKASAEERHNIEWARNLENDGIRVILSPAGLKVHAKIALIVRREDGRLRSYAYVGTGNLKPATAASYVDLGLLTTDPDVTHDIAAIFNLLTGACTGPGQKCLLVAPFDMRRRFLQLIDRETQHARAGRPAAIRAQLNGLADRRLIHALYDASRAGVPVHLVVREICALRPGLPGVSENIRVVSLVGRFLQHARIFHFRNGGRDEYFIGSADWRPRNFAERIEVVAPIRLPEHQTALDRVLDSAFQDPDAWLLTPDGRYMRGSTAVG